MSLGFGRGPYSLTPWASTHAPQVTEVLTLSEGLSIGESVNLPVVLTLEEGMSPFVANATDNLSLSESFSNSAQYGVTVSEIMSLYEYNRAASFRVIPQNGNLLEVEFPDEMQLEGLLDPIRYTLRGQGIALTIETVTSIVTVKQSGTGTSVGSGFSSTTYDTLTGQFNPSHKGEYLHFGTESFRILDGLGSVVSLDRSFPSGPSAWSHTSAATGVTLKVTESTLGRSYTLGADGLRRRYDGSFFSASADFTGLGEKPRVVSVDFLDSSSVRVLFSEGMRVDAELVDPSEYSFTGPSDVEILNVTTEGPQALILRTSGFLPGVSYTLVVNAVGTPKDVAGNPIDPVFNTAVFTTTTPILSKSIFTDRGPIAKPKLVLHSGVNGSIQTTTTRWFGVVTTNEVRLPGAVLTSAVVGTYLKLDSSVNRGEYRILSYVGDKVTVSANLRLPDASNGSLTWEVFDPRAGEIADDPSDVVVRVNGSPVVPTAVIGLLGQVILPSQPSSSDTVEVDYSFIESPTVEIRRLNSKEFCLNSWNSDNNKLGVSQHKYRYRNVLPGKGGYNAATITAKTAEPLSRNTYYKAFERVYTATLNDPGTLRLNTPVNRVSYPATRRSLTETSVLYSGSVLPELDGWERKGFGQASIGSGSLVFKDVGATPVFWTRSVDITYNHVLAMSWRIQVTSTTPQGVFTGVAVGWSGPLHGVVLGFLVDGGVKKVGFLRAGGDPSDIGSWYGTPTGNTFGPLPAPLDWSLLRSYRLLRDKVGNLKFYVDGNLSPTLVGLEGYGPKLSDLVSPFDEIQGAFFGSLSKAAICEGDMDFVRYLVLPTNTQESAPQVECNFEGTDYPEVALTPWTPIGGYGTANVQNSNLVLDSYHGEVSSLGAVEGAYKGFVRLEPLLPSAYEWDVDFSLSLRTSTFGVTPNGVTLAVDDGTYLTQVSFLSSVAQAKYSYVGDKLPPAPWLSLGSATAEVVGRTLRLTDASFVDGRVFALEDQESLASPNRVLAPSLDFFVEARVQVSSYNPDGSGFCGVTFDAYDGNRVIGVLLRESGGVREVAFHSDGTVLSSFQYEWFQGRPVTLKVRKNLVGDLVTLVVDNVVLGTLAYSAFSVGSGNATLSFGSATAISSSSHSVVDWNHVNCWGTYPSSQQRYVGIWKGTNTGTLRDYFLPLKADTFVRVAGNTLTSVGVDFGVLGVAIGDSVILDSGLNVGVHEVSGVSGETILLTQTLLTEGETRVRVPAETDWSQPKKYRALRDGSGNLTLSVEGQVVIRLDYGVLNLPSSASGIFSSLASGLPSIAWGAFQGGELSQAGWDFVRYVFRSSSADPSRIVPKLGTLNQRNVISSPEHLKGEVAHGHTQYSSASTGVPYPWHEYVRDVNSKAFTQLWEGTPLVPSTQAYEVRRPTPRVTFVHGLNNPSDVLNGSSYLNAAETQIQIVVPKDVLYHNLVVEETSSGERDVLTIAGDNGLSSLGTLQWQKDVCLHYTADNLPELDSSFVTPWVLESDVPGSVSATVFGGALTYGVGVTPTNTLYRNATPLTDPVSLNSKVEFRLRVLEDTTLGTGDSGIRFGFSALGLTAALSFVAAPNGIREVQLLDLATNEVLTSTPFDYLDGEYHVYRLTKNAERGTLDFVLDP